MNNDNYIQAAENFTKVYQKMYNALIEYIEKQGGTIESGEIKGLQDGILKHVEIRNDQLNSLLNYYTESEIHIKALENRVKQLDIENSLLQKGRQGETYSNDKILKEIDFYLAYEVSEETTLDDFTDVLRQTKFFIELALKRKILTPVTPEHENKLKWANIFLENTHDLKTFFNNKKKKLGNVAPSVSNLLQT
jgi:hypothetical protein